MTVGDSFPFGYKMGWFAVRTTDPGTVASALGLSVLRQADWEEGLEEAYRKDDVLFIAPSIRGWSLAIGSWTMGKANERSVQSLQNLMVRLSAQFGEAQGFATYRIVEYHHWILARHGILMRAYAYLGESGEVLANVGKLTPAEGSLGWASLPEDEWIPDEEDVMQVAGHWSIHPGELNPQASTEPMGILTKAPR